MTGCGWIRYKTAIKAKWKRKRYQQRVNQYTVNDTLLFDAVSLVEGIVKTDF